MDVGLNELFGYLEQSGRANDIAVILTADHGVNLPAELRMDRSRRKDLMISSQQVPLLVRCPWRPEANGQVVSGFVEASIDLYPTVLELAGVPVETPGFSRSVLPDRQGGWVTKSCCVAETIFGGMHQILIVDAAHQYLRRCRWREGVVSEEVRERSTGTLLSPSADGYDRLVRRYHTLMLERGLLDWETSVGEPGRLGCPGPQPTDGVAAPQGRPAHAALAPSGAA